MSRSTKTNKKKIAKLYADLESATQRLQSGRLDEARFLCEHVLEQHTDQPDALHLLGLVEYQLGRHDQAIALVRSAIKQHDRMHAYHHHLAEMLRTRGDLNEAQASYQRALELEPHNADSLFGFANTLAQSGNHNEAVTKYREALVARPNDILGWCQLGEILEQASDRKQAIECYQNAVTRQPNDAQAQAALGRALIRDGDVTAGIDVLRRATELDPKLADAHNALAKALLDEGRHQEALAHFQGLVETHPNLASAHFGMGVCLQQLGRFEEAAIHHLKARSIDPNLASVDFNLGLSGIEVEPEEIDRLSAMLGQSSLPDGQRAQLHFALANRLDLAQRFDEAFEHYDYANELKASESAFDVEAFSQTVDEIRELFTEEYFSERKNFGLDSDMPVLIVGMPRSGTTLVEQIIASHPQAFGAGELTALTRLVAELPTRLNTTSPFPHCVNNLNAEVAAELAREYLDELQDRGGCSLRVVDKMPNNYLRLGLLALMLPRARVIHCKRDPRDTCLSCYFQNFAMERDFTTDLTMLARVYLGYTRLMDHWRKALPLNMLEIQYEELVEHPDTLIPRIIDHCGLEWDDACLEFHKHERQIRTASFWQARQPLYTSAAGRWRNYEQYLTPLTAVLGASL